MVVTDVQGTLVSLFLHVVLHAETKHLDHGQSLVRYGLALRL